MKFIREAFDSNWIAPLGPNVQKFEVEMADYTGVMCALAVSSGTAAIHLALKYLGVGEGDLVFCSSFTFSGSCNPVLYQNARPVFIDSEPDTWNMSPIALEKAFRWAADLGKMPKAVIIVDLYGQSADWDELLPICSKYGVPVVEDAAEAVGATYKGSKCGSFGDFGIFSFNGNKILTTSGGGMILCHDYEAREKMLFWATQACEDSLHYEHRETGYNYRLSNVCAGIGRGQYRILFQKLNRRKEIFERYQDLFCDTGIQMMPVSRNGIPNHWLSVITLDRDCDVFPEEIVSRMSRLQYQTRPAWKPMHMQPLFCGCKGFPHEDGWFICKDIYRRSLCLPSGDALTEEAQTLIVNSILRIYKRLGIA